MNAIHAFGMDIMPGREKLRFWGKNCVKKQKFPGRLISIEITGTKAKYSRHYSQ